jgi:DNA helicase HerA-like ATPase
LDDLLTSAGVTIVDLSDVYDSEERVDKIARMLDQLLEFFQFQEDPDDLMLLVVVEEAHLRTSKDPPKDAVPFLDNAVGLLRKNGVGVMLVSQKISDFDPAMRLAMNVSILFRTKYEGDLRAVARMIWGEASGIVPKRDGMVTCPEISRTRTIRPYVSQTDTETVV